MIKLPLEYQMLTEAYLPIYLCDSSDIGDCNYSYDSCDSSDISLSRDGSDRSGSSGKIIQFFFVFLKIVSKTQMVTKIINSKTQIVTKLKNSSCDQTLNLNCHKT